MIGQTLTIKIEGGPKAGKSRLGAPSTRSGPFPAGSGRAGSALYYISAFRLHRRIDIGSIALLSNQQSGLDQIA